MSSSRRHPGFTLIELMIAMAIGLVIVYVAFAGFRVAEQSVAVSHRLSTENSMMRAGFLAALEEVDHWTMYDDPNDASNQKLRGITRVGDAWNINIPNGPWYGLPFTPFKVSFPAGGAFTGADGDRGWDPNYEWPANDPRTWYRCNRAEWSYSTHAFGNYEIFSHLKSSINLTGGYTIGLWDNWAQTYPKTPAFGAATVRHTWLPNQLYDLKNALGYYGMMDYMPTDAVFGVYGQAGADGILGTADDIDQRNHPEWNVVDYAYLGPTAAGMQHFRDLRDCALWSVYAIIPSNQWSGFVNASAYDLGAWHRWFFATVRNTSKTTTKDFLNATEIVMPLMPIKPESWPDVSMSVTRYLADMQYRNLCKVRWRSPLTGEVAELSFSAMSTTLRGARQQRGLDDY